MSDLGSAGPRLSREAFTAIVDAQQGVLASFLAHLVAAPEALDLVQETFLDAWRSAARGEPPLTPGAPPGEVRRWLFRVGYHNAMSHLRRARRARWDTLDPLLETLPATEAAFDTVIVEADALRLALTALSHEDIACLMLRVAHGFSATEVGTILGVSPESVHTRLGRAKRRLRVAYLRVTAAEEETRR